MIIWLNVVLNVLNRTVLTVTGVFYMEVGDRPQVRKVTRLSM